MRVWILPCTSMSVYVRTGGQCPGGLTLLHRPLRQVPRCQPPRGTACWGAGCLCAHTQCSVEACRHHDCPKHDERAPQSKGRVTARTGNGTGHVGHLHGMSWYGITVQRVKQTHVSNTSGGSRTQWQWSLHACTTRAYAAITHTVHSYKLTCPIRLAVTRLSATIRASSLPLPAALQISAAMARRLKGLINRMPPARAPLSLVDVCALRRLPELATPLPLPLPVPVLSEFTEFTAAVNAQGWFSSRGLRSNHADHAV